MFEGAGSVLAGPLGASLNLMAINFTSLGRNPTSGPSGISASPACGISQSFDQINEPAAGPHTEALAFAFAISRTFRLFRRRDLIFSSSVCWSWSKWADQQPASGDKQLGTERPQSDPGKLHAHAKVAAMARRPPTPR